MHCDCALYSAACFSQNMAPQRSGCTCQHLCLLRWPEAWIWCKNNAGLSAAASKQWDMRPPELSFQSDQGPDGGWNNRSVGILIGLWPETDGNVHHLVIDILMFFLSNRMVWKTKSYSKPLKGLTCIHSRKPFVTWRAWHILALWHNSHVTHQIIPVTRHNAFSDFYT